MWVCEHGPRGGAAAALWPAEREAHTGIWRARHARDLSGRTYRYLVEVFVPSQGWVINRVTDPYSISLTADSQHSYIGRLDDPKLAPPGWQGHPRPAAPKHAVDMVISELHVRDFSAGDRTVPAAHRGKYRAFTHVNSDGMRHLADMARAGLTDVHLLPIFDLATVPEKGCKKLDETPLRAAAPDSTQQQALVQGLTASTYRVAGRGPFGEEFVTAGGVDLGTINLATMESRLCPGLQVVGELLDIDGVTGGFNFQHCWSSGWLAGQAIAAAG